MVTIIQKGDKVLRKVSDEVPKNDIAKPKIQNLIKTMKKTLAKENDGVGLAAPQIGISLRIFIVSGKIFVDYESETKEIPQDLAFINPRIVKSSRKTETLDEGCLSVRPWYGKVKRSEKITVRAYNEKGEIFERGASGVLAQIFQHEIDHLNGILFTDTATDLREMPENPNEHNL